MRHVEFSISPITTEDDEAICAIIKQVGQEYGAIGDGYGPSDSEVAEMSKHYSDEDASCYFVARVGEKIVGGGGIACFNGSRSICELKKLFLLPEARGIGLGKALTEKCLSYARGRGYQECYLDTLSNMESAIQLYTKLGFHKLKAPLQGTIHNGCDVWMIKVL